MNVMVWFHLMPSVVLQGVFPPTVDSPRDVQSSNRTSDSATETKVDEEFEIFGQISSSLADGIVLLITSLDTADDNTTNTNTTEEDSSVFTGWFHPTRCKGAQ